MKVAPTIPISPARAKPSDATAGVGRIRYPGRMANYECGVIAVVKTVIGLAESLDIETEALE
jgi:hypothetical protein